MIPLLPLIHQGAVLAIALALRAISSSLIVKQLLMQIGLDPVYASVFNRTLGNIEARGLAAAGPLGDILHQLAPALFASPDQVVPGAWATALIGDGASLLASAIAMVGTEVIFIAVGLVMLGVALRDGRASKRAPFLALALLGLMFQARGLVGLFRLRFSLEDMEIMGLSHFFTKLFPVDAESYQELVAEPFRTFAPYLVPFIIIFTIYGALLCVILLRTRIRLRKDERGESVLGRMLLWPRRLADNRSAYAALVPIALFVGAILSQEFFPALANYNYPAEGESVSAQLVDESVPGSAAPDGPPTAKVDLVSGPSRVTVTGASLDYSYKVNGHPEKIRGIGYNAMYSHLSPPERAARYDQDFAQMKAAGVNTILGWEREQFDELTLEKAQQYGLGVVMPYYLPRDGDYGNITYERDVERDVKEWVKRFRQYPALRMWGIGNEVIHGMGNPETPKARAFAQFYVGLADAVRALDPDHPVTYRDAEDLYLGPIRDALRKDGVRRSWFVYGVNFFTFRICEALPSWPKRDFDVPVIVSEFAPSGLGPGDRPKGYLRMLKCIMKEQPLVLGGFAYVWTTSGPEAIDRVMGLVDGEGRPVDRSLGVLKKAFRYDKQGRLDSLELLP
ncbi:MAG: glycoside hydrolase family 2 TIM barrel-domain containing protein [Dehalococcoidia bacterium]|nr:glycoside hydrolase family 2 TIM barrel-domain containing protein [Dehalococcoidia bacterium]